MKIKSRTSGSALILIAVLFLYSVSASATQPDMDSENRESNMSMQYLVGAAKKDMTPDLESYEVSLNGYGDRKRGLATGVLDPIWARALVVGDNKGTTAALISVDLCYVNTELRDAVVEKLTLMGFSPHGVLLAATHTHSGFSGYDACFVAKTFMGKYQQAIFDHTVNSIVGAVAAAKESMRPATLRYAVENVKGLSRSRLDPHFRHDKGGYEGRPAPSGLYSVNARLTAIAFTGLKGKPISTLVNFAAHPTTLSPKNMKFSADYPGVLYEKIEKEMGGGATAIFFNGALGDAAPLPDWSNPDQEIRDMNKFGDDLSDQVVRIMKKTTAPKSKSVVAFASVKKPLRRVVLRPLGRLRLPEMLSKGFYTNPEVTFQALRIGDFVFLAAPGEATTSVGKDLESMCPKDLRCVTVAPANGYMGYIVSREEYDKSGYESDSCLFGPDAAMWTKRSIGQAMEMLGL